MLGKKIVAEKRLHGQQLDDLIRRLDYEERRLEKESMEPVTEKKPKRLQVTVEE